MKVHVSLALELEESDIIDTVVDPSCECLKCCRVEGLIVAFWHIKPYGCVKCYRGFGRACCLRLQSSQRKGIERERNNSNLSQSYCVSPEIFRAFFVNVFTILYEHLATPSVFLDKLADRSSKLSRNVGIKNHGVISQKTRLFILTIIHVFVLLRYQERFLSIASVYY
jgi:hypothetical protein